MTLFNLIDTCNSIIGKLNKFSKPSEASIYLIAVLAILAYYVPYFVLGENAHILIHDNLDSNLAWMKILIDRNSVFSCPLKIFPDVLGGLYFYQINGTYDIPMLIYNFFGIYNGYVLNKLLISTIGFFGMFLLLRRYFNNGSDSTIIHALTALIFSLLPFWSFTASVLGVPFALYAFLNIRKKSRSIMNYFILILFPFYTSLIFSGVFLLIILTFITLLDIYKNRKINWFSILCLFVLSLLYIVSHFPLFYGFLFDSSISHRKEFFQPFTSLDDSWKSSLNMFKNGQYHAHSLHYKFIFYPLLAIIFFKFKSIKTSIKLMLLFIIISSLSYGFKNHFLMRYMAELITNIIPIQNRFYTLNPTFWYIILGYALSLFAKKNKYKHIIALLLLLFHLNYVVRNHELIVNKNSPNFKEFYNEKVFTKIKNVINKPIKSYKIISVGMHPAISQYNGFNTLDGYFPNYSLNYKHQFRKAIQGELNRSKELKTYFDGWGSRCYGFSSEIGKDFMYNKNKEIDTLNFDFEIVKQMGGMYVFSSTSISEAINTQLHLIGKFNTNNSYWTIFVYKIQ